MLQITYQAQLPKGRYKSLSYAILFARAIYAELSVRLPVQRIVRLSPSIGHTGLPERINHTPADSGHADLIMRGKPKRGSYFPTDNILFPVQDHRRHAPVILIPYGYRFKGMDNVLFAGHTEDLMDQSLIHQLAAAFCPRAFQLDGPDIKHVHWNNVFLMPGINSEQQLPPPPVLNEQIKKMKIDLMIMPLPVRSKQSISRWHQQMIAEIDTPTLLIPHAATLPAKSRPSRKQLSID